MRRADRLFQIIQILRGGRLVTAHGLAAQLEVSERTIYRDIRDLMLSGVPIEGEAGVGYLMKKGFDLPPLMFDAAELEALLVGARMTKSWADAKLARAAERALQKIEAVLPDNLKEELGRTHIFVPEFNPYPNQPLAPLRQATAERRKLYLEYTRLDGEQSRRVIRPLGLFFWGKKWTLVAWCEYRDDFRHFRVDRMASIRILEDCFEQRPGQQLKDFLRLVGAPDNE